MFPIVIAVALIAGPVEAEVVRVIDGDTVAVRAHVWPGMVAEAQVRVRGIDAPELAGRCRRERERARAARAALAGMIGPTVTLTAIAPDKYGGRVIADVRSGDRSSIAERLMADGVARPYDGGTRRDWCRD